MKRIETLRGRVLVDSPGLEAKLEWSPGFQSIMEDRFDSAQVYAESEVIRLSEPYTPKLTGMMIMSADLGTIPGEGVVRWIAPYSRYQYYGKCMVGPAPRKVSEKNLQYHGGGLRGAFWFERMKTNHLQEIIDGAGVLFGGVS